MTTAQSELKENGRSLKSYFPILTWLPAYQKGWLRGDIVAALTVWALVVPEAMAYASIAGVPPEAGLYAAPLALIAYAIFGTSRHLHVGPSSAVAALSFSVVAGLAVVGSDDFLLYSIALAFMVGAMLIAGGFLKLGVLADFLSRPVLDGFVVGVAVSIAVGQLSKVLGFEPTEVEIDLIPDILLILRDIGQTHFPTLLVGAISLGTLFAMHKYTPKLPSALVVLFLSIAASTAFDFHGMHIHIVGEIPAGLPPFGLPDGFNLEKLLSVAAGSLGVALVAFAESVAIARAYSVKFGYEVDANQELIALGAGNLGSGFSGGFVGDGSMSRTSAAVESGAKSQMVSIVAAIAILITAALFTAFFHNLPEATLGAIVIHAVWKNINYNKISKYRHITTLDFATALVAAVGVLLLGLLQGLLLAALLGLVVLLWGTKTRRTSVLGRVQGTAVYRSLNNFADGETYPGLIILRFDGSLFFANAHDFITAVRHEINATEPAPSVILLDCESINHIDATAVVTLAEFHNQVAETSGRELWLTRVKTNVRDVMERGGLTKNIPPNRFYTTVQDGVDAFLEEKGLD